MSGRQSLVSVVIPTKNRCALLEQALKSVRQQTYTHWEVLVVDDGSSDGSAVMVQRYCQLDGRFKWIVRPKDQKPGGSTCRNIGLSHSAGEFVIFLDSDDLLADGCLQGRTDNISKHPELDFIVYQAEAFELVPGDLKAPFNVPKPRADLDRLLELDHPWQTTGPIWRSASLRGIGGWDSALPSWQDWELHLRALCRKLNYRTEYTCDYYFRRHCSGGRTNSLQRQDPGHLSAAIAMFGKVRDELRQTGNLNAERRQAVEGLAFLTAIRFNDHHGLRSALGAWWRAYRFELTGVANFVAGSIALVGLRPVADRGFARKTLLRLIRFRIRLCKTK